MVNPAPSPDRRALLQDALLALDDLQAKLDRVEQARIEPIAIVGIGCRFPGGANSPEAYWRLLLDRVDAIREVPADRWRVADYADTPWYGGFLDTIDQFDPAFFGIAPREADPVIPDRGRPARSSHVVRRTLRREFS